MFNRDANRSSIILVPRCQHKQFLHPSITPTHICTWFILLERDDLDALYIGEALSGLDFLSGDIFSWPCCNLVVTMSSITNNQIKDHPHPNIANLNPLPPFTPLSCRIHLDSLVPTSHTRLNTLPPRFTSIWHPRALVLHSWITFHGKACWIFVTTIYYPQISCPTRFCPLSGHASPNNTPKTSQLLF